MKKGDRREIGRGERRGRGEKEGGKKWGRRIGGDRESGKE